MASGVRTTALTLTAVAAFAANSLLGRLALGTHAIDAASFTGLRLVSGAAMLAAIAAARSPRSMAADGSWVSAAWMVVYAFPFSFAYLSLTAATGALVLFAAVQATMIGSAWVGGLRPGWPEAAGVLTAGGGLAYLVWPGVTAPSPGGAALMAVAGVAWGVYSLRGRQAASPLTLTAGNFLKAAPMALAVSLVFVSGAHVSLRGALLAIVSGAVTSGLGYVVWYAALPHLSALGAAVVQLGVPVLAAIGGIVFLGEAATSRLGLASLLVLGGVGVALGGRRAA